MNETYDGIIFVVYAVSWFLVTYSYGIPTSDGIVGRLAQKIGSSLTQNTPMQVLKVYVLLLVLLAMVMSFLFTVTMTLIFSGVVGVVHSMLQVFLGRINKENMNVYSEGFHLILDKMMQPMNVSSHISERFWGSYGIVILFVMLIVACHVGILGESALANGGTDRQMDGGVMYRMYHHAYIVLAKTLLVLMLCVIVVREMSYASVQYNP